MSPSISFIIPVYNGEEYIAQAINSALQQDYDNFDVIVVNDGSKDGTLEVLKNLSNPKLKVVNLEHNQGRSSARNIGVKHSHAEFIALLDADDKIESSKLKQQMKYILDHKLDICGTWGYAITNGERMLFKHPVEDSIIKSRIIKSHTFIHSSVLCRRELFLSVGGYDTGLSFSEDYDLFLRIVQTAKCGNLPVPTVEYNMPSGLTYAFKEQKAISTIRLRAILKYGYGLQNLLYVITPVISLFIPRKLKIFIKKIIN